MKLIAFILVAPLAIGAGCRTTVKEIDTAKLYSAFVNQPNNTVVQQISGPNVTWTITGATNIAFYAPIPAKQIMPRDATWTEGLFDFLKSATPWLAVYGMSGALNGSSSSATTLGGTTSVSLPAATTPATP